MTSFYFSVVGGIKPVQAWESWKTMVATGSGLKETWGTMVAGKFILLTMVMTQVQNSEKDHVHSVKL